jgi:alkylated DNA repair dioxygenase AlkB
MGTNKKSSPNRMGSRTNGITFTSIHLHMSLFDNKSPINLLPKDGTVLYHGKIMTEQHAGMYLEKLLHHIEWKHDEAIIYGKHIITKRKVAWYGDQNYAYTYSNTTKQALPWTTELIALKALVEQHTATRFNSCLLNLYHDGEEGMAWHSDDEKSLEKNSSIASLSFGAERKFSFKHKETKETLSLLLEQGSLLLMKGTTQTHWWHSLPKTKKVNRPRINLTFRSMAEVL